MFSRKRVITHIVLWAFIMVGIFLSFTVVSPGLIFGKDFNEWLIIVPLTIFLFYHVSTAAYHHCRLDPRVGSEKRIIRAGHYAKCVHPTCTTIVIISWIIFFYFPDWRVFLSVLWLTIMIFSWIRIEKSFFLGRISKTEKKKPEPV